MATHIDVIDLASRLRAAEEPFALATVVRTISVTAAKAGAKAVIHPDGRIEAGWIGGGCARSAALKAAREALADGCSRLVSIQPQDLLDELGVKPGEQSAGIKFARNMCPSQGTMDIFIEPMLPRPSLVVLGSSPVALALAGLGMQMGFHVTLAAPLIEFQQTPEADSLIDGFHFSAADNRHRFVVVSTQGKGDETALKAALTINASYYGFVGSRRKMAALRENLPVEGTAFKRLGDIKGPAGLDIGAITPDEIALSIIAEITQHRRRKQRTPD